MQTRTTLAVVTLIATGVLIGWLTASVDLTRDAQATIQAPLIAVPQTKTAGLAPATPAAEGEDQ